MYRWCDQKKFFYFLHKIYFLFRESAQTRTQRVGPRWTRSLIQGFLPKRLKSADGTEDRNKHRHSRSARRQFHFPAVFLWERKNDAFLRSQHARDLHVTARFSGPFHRAHLRISPVRYQWTLGR